MDESGLSKQRGHLANGRETHNVAMPGVSSGCANGKCWWGKKSVEEVIQADQKRKRMSERSD